MLRHERQAQRLRGAGRVLVDEAPIVFLPRDKRGFTTAAARDVLVPIEASAANASGRKTKQTSKMMDFRTPKSTRKSIVSKITPLQTPSRRKSLLKISDREKVSILPRDVLGIDAPLSMSTPEDSKAPTTPGHLQDFEIISPGQDVLAQANAVEDLEITRSEVEQSRVETPMTLGKRKRQDNMDHEVPIKSTPCEKPKKRLRGVLRELGLGASRFIVGAPNYATPARRKSIAFTKVILGQPRLEDRRASSRLKAQQIAAYKKENKNNRATKLQRLVKSCATCLGTKAWRRWHAMNDGSWKCNRCFVPIGEPQERGVNHLKRGRAGRVLSEADLALIYARRREGVTFNAIAKELGYWKTGQSVKNYLARHPSLGDELRLTGKKVSESSGSGSVPKAKGRKRVGLTKTEKVLPSSSVPLEDCDI